MPTSQIRHCHDFHHKAGPACKVLRTLTAAGLRVVLLPCKPRPLPLVEYVINKISTQGRVQGPGTSLVSRCRPSSNVLYKRTSQPGCSEESFWQLLSVSALGGGNGKKT